ncbi:3-phosphoshikimate 1-carboxyvinyltransferase, partial [mine drainage metagenome]
MNGVEIGPGPVSGRLPAPPSKSYTHRALVAGYLTGRRYRIRDPNPSLDTRATRDGLAALGTLVESSEREWCLRPGTEPAPDRARVACGSSGTTLRFLTAVGASTDARLTFT